MRMRRWVGPTLRRAFLALTSVVASGACARATRHRKPARSVTRGSASVRLLAAADNSACPIGAGSGHATVGRMGARVHRERWRRWRQGWRRGRQQWDRWREPVDTRCTLHERRGLRLRADVPDDRRRRSERRLHRGLHARHHGVRRARRRVQDLDRRWRQLLRRVLQLRAQYERRFQHEQVSRAARVRVRVVRDGPSRNGLHESERLHPRTDLRRRGPLRRHRDRLHSRVRQ